MTTEEKLKKYILSHYKSVHEFTQSINMTYGTIASIFKRGINNSSVTNIIKICTALGISTDELAKGNIVTIQKGSEDQPTKIETIIEHTKQKLLQCKNPTLDDHPVTAAGITELINNLDLILEIQRRNMKK